MQEKLHKEECAESASLLFFFSFFSLQFCVCVRARARTCMWSIEIRGLYLLGLEEILGRGRNMNKALS